MSLGEFDLIDTYFRRRSTADSVALGIGDDGALLKPRDGQELVAVVDTLVEGVHFPLRFSAADVGWRLAAVNLSDIAAMGALPRWATLSLTLPAVDEAWLGGFSEGLHAALDAVGVALVGGDTTRGDQLVVSLQLLGEVAPGEALRRSGAIAGDKLFVSGHPGDAAAGLRQLQAGVDDENSLIGRFRRPQPRLSLGERLRSLATSAIDVSDGLYADVAKLARASGVAATLEIDALPLSDALLEVFPNDAVSLALGGGDDYELCFTVPAAHVDDVLALQAPLAVKLTQIGEVASGDGLTCRQAGVPYDVKTPGFEHFSVAQ